jgi:hypothetical protein
MPYQYFCSVLTNDYQIPVTMDLSNLVTHHRGQLHYKSAILGMNMTRTKMRLLNRNVSFVSKKSSQDVEEGSSDEESEVDISKTKKKAVKRGRKKATIDTSEGETQKGQKGTEDASPEETKTVKKRGRKKGNVHFFFHSRVLLLCIGQWTL